jgi:hypothetical protein
MERAVLLSAGPSLRVPLAEILTDSDLSAASRGNAVEQAEREQTLRALRKQLGRRRCSRSGSSPGRQEDLARLQDAEIWDLSPSPVTNVEGEFRKLRRLNQTIPESLRTRRYSIYSGQPDGS